MRSTRSTGSENRGLPVIDLPREVAILGAAIKASAASGDENEVCVVRTECEIKVKLPEWPLCGIKIVFTLSKNLTRVSADFHRRINQYNHVNTFTVIIAFYLVQLPSIK